MRSVILMPAYNEERSLPDVLPLLLSLYADFDAVVIDDGSSDRTSAVARSYGATVLRHPFKLGYGAALQTGYKFALEVGARLVVQMDADGQHDPDEVQRLVGPILDETADLVVGSRFAQPTSYRMGFARTVGRLLFQRIALWARLQITDPTSGFQAMNSKALELYTGAFFPCDYPDVDVLLIAHRSGLRIRECSVNMRPEQRESRLHGGARSFYYMYRMALSLWAGAKSKADA